MSVTDILLVDDDAAIRTVVSHALRRAGHEVRVATDLATLDAALAEATPDVLITDVVLPDGDGIERATSLLHSENPPAIIVLSARNTLATAVRAAEAGVYEYLPKPFDLDALTRAVAGALAGSTTNESVSAAPDPQALPLIGRSPAMQEVYRVIARVISNDLTVLIAGESGTGKELVARAIHDLGRRRSGPFVAINMAAIPRELIEAELFGYERGAFTGATQRTIGRFEQAAGGTLMLDEIGDMPLDAQTRLLRVLQEGEFSTIGGTRSIRANVRIVAASNRDLLEQVASGTFRQDLYYRLAVVPIALPPLRERREDVRMLVSHFLEQAAGEGLPHKSLDDHALAILERHDWPGNVRELENLIRRLTALSRDRCIGASDITRLLGRLGEPMHEEQPTLAQAVRQRVAQIGSKEPDSLGNGTLYQRIVSEIEKPLIEAMLERHGGNQLQTARALGMNRNTLRKRLDTLAIELG